MARLTISKNTGKFTDYSKRIIENAMWSGRVLRVSRPEIVRAVTEYAIEEYEVKSGDSLIKETLDEVLNIDDTDKGNKVLGMCFGKVLGMRCITFVLKKKSIWGNYATIYDDLAGSIAFCYVLNLDEPGCSDFGDCRFRFFFRAN